LQKDSLHVSVVGSGGTLGKEIKSSLEERKLPICKINLLDSKKYEGVMTEFGSEAHLIAPVEENSFIHSDIVFLCCSHEDGLKYLAFPRKKQSLLIDFSMAGLKKEHIPIVNHDINGKGVYGLRGIVSAPHPPSMFLTNILHPLDEAFGVERAAVQVFQPASDLGEEGVEELSLQTINLLNFSKVPKKIFGRQLAFNVMPSSMLPQKPGEESMDSDLCLEISEILGWRPARLAIRMFMIPVFYCHSFSIHLTFRSRIKAADVLERLQQTNPVKLLAKGAQGATPVEATGNREIFMSELRGDGLADGGFWLWLVSDNLFSLAALNAVKIAEAFIAGAFSH
jgi:aspartate-semialdehyde dehydrogenase